MRNEPRPDRPQLVEHLHLMDDKGAHSLEPFGLSTEDMHAALDALGFVPHRKDDCAACAAGDGTGWAPGPHALVMDEVTLDAIRRCFGPASLFCDPRSFQLFGLFVAHAVNAARQSRELESAMRAGGAL